jgi:hypothetical protein
LCVEGQVVAIVDKICALAQKLVQEGNYCWQSVIFVMHVPSTAFFEDVQNAALRLLKKLSLPFNPAYSHAQYRLIIDKCIERRAALQHWFSDFMLLVNQHKAELTIHEPFNALELVQKLERTIANVGLLCDEQQAWLEVLKQQMSRQDYPDVEEFVLLLDEIEYRYFFVMRKLQELDHKVSEKFTHLHTVSRVKPLAN